MQKSKEKNVKQPVAGRSSHMLQVILGLKKNLPSGRGHSVFKICFFSDTACSSSK